MFLIDSDHFSTLAPLALTFGNSKMFPGSYQFQRRLNTEWNGSVHIYKLREDSRVLLYSTVV
jgi:hypothetical protein